MHSFLSRAGRWPLALTLFVAGGLAACGEQPSGPDPSAALKPRFAAGDVYTVTTTADTGGGSLRWALSHATGGEDIRFHPSLEGQTINLGSTLTLDVPVRIEGPAGRGIAINGGKQVRLFEITHSGVDPVYLTNLHLKDGKSPDNGSAGAVLGQSGHRLVIQHSTVSGNESPSISAIYVGQIAMSNVTVSGNVSTGAVPFSAVVATGDLTLVNSTIAHNVGSGVSASQQFSLRNSLLANNTVANCSYLGQQQVYEMKNMSSDGSCGGPNDVIVADPKLSALAANGGPGPTHALMAGSPAIGVGISCQPVDQRYIPRDTPCDLGAFEFIDPSIVTLTIDGGAAAVQGAGWATVTGTVKCSRDESMQLEVKLAQLQKAGRDTVNANAATTIPLACGPSARNWSASMALSSGTFQVGSATADAKTVSVPGWVSPASASKQVKVYWSKK